MGRKKISDFAMGSKSTQHTIFVWTWGYGIFFFRERSLNHHESSHFTANYHHPLLLLLLRCYAAWIESIDLLVICFRLNAFDIWNRMEWNEMCAFQCFQYHLFIARRWGQELIYFSIEFCWTCWHALLRERDTEQKDDGTPVDIGMCSCRASIIVLSFAFRKFCEEFKSIWLLFWWFRIIGNGIFSFTSRRNGNGACLRETEMSGMEMESPKLMVYSFEMPSIGCVV